MLIGTAAYGSERFFKVYQCRKCSCWAKQRLEPTGEEELSRGEIVESPSVDRTNDDEGRVVELYEVECQNCGNKVPSTVPGDNLEDEDCVKCGSTDFEDTGEMVEVPHPHSRWRSQ